MIGTRSFAAALMSAVFLAGGTATLALAPTAAYAQAKKEVSPEVGKPLQEADGLVKQKKFKEALEKVDAADKAKKTPWEAYTVEMRRYSVYGQSGDAPKAIKALEAAMDTGQMSEGEKEKMTVQLAQMNFSAKNYAKALELANKAVKEGNNSDLVQNLIVQSYYYQNDCPNATKTARTIIGNAEKANRKPDENLIQLWMACDSKTPATAQGYYEGIEKAVQYYPKKDYWLALIALVQKKPGFSSDRLALDVARLKLALGVLDKSSDYMEMAQLSLQTGNAGEGTEIIDKGYKFGVLGQGNEAERHKRLRDLAAKQLGDDKPQLAQTEAAAARKPDGVDLFKVGEAYAGYGQFDKGIQLMQTALTKGGFKNPEEQRLHLGYWQIKSGKKPAAIETLKQVKGTAGEADIARMWTMFAASGPVAQPTAAAAPAAAAAAPAKKKS